LRDQMALFQEFRDNWRRTHPKTLAEINPDDIDEGIIPAWKVIGIYERLLGGKGLEYRRVEPDNPHSVKAHFANCPRIACGMYIGISSHGFHQEYCPNCGTRIAPESEHDREVVVRAISYFEGI